MKNVLVYHLFIFLCDFYIQNVNIIFSKTVEICVKWFVSENLYTIL